jgi:hypothetical protein
MSDPGDVGATLKAPITMSAEQEYADRNMADSFPCNDQRARAWSEIDALRARLAEVERERDEARNLRDQYEARAAAAEDGERAALAATAPQKEDDHA